MERILVTSGAGYIGTHLVELLLSQRHRVRVIDNGTFGMSGLRPFLWVKPFRDATRGHSGYRTSPKGGRQY